ncbi:biopolymer transport protein ExbD [Sulfitobacter marinus]|uniref:Biopolymer transport protein ExbD n=1 Tax=Sulfitobacter marinus TaxID=394264 RepID=A0A1I6QT55_9RHOB|nr:biopolymer transporter ExbD [Sulfitobacter marinus]SFS55666.1 biopolymer transport protein ExbD [Sulfitobacter marinus]
MRKFAKAKPQREPTIALINIVFLMLVFFMVAGTLAQPLDPSLTLVETRELDGQAPPNALVVYPDGRISFEGEDQADAATFVASLSEEDRETVRIVPDRTLPAAALVSLTRDLRSAGAQRVMLVTKRALE